MFMHPALVIPSLGNTVNDYHQDVIINTMLTPSIQDYAGYVLRAQESALLDASELSVLADADSSAEVKKTLFELQTLACSRIEQHVGFVKQPFSEKALLRCSLEDTERGQKMLFATLTTEAIAKGNLTESDLSEFLTSTPRDYFDALHDSLYTCESEATDQEKSAFSLRIELPDQTVIENTQKDRYAMYLGLDSLIVFDLYGVNALIEAEGDKGFSINAIGDTVKKAFQIIGRYYPVTAAGDINEFGREEITDEIESLLAGNQKGIKPSESTEPLEWLNWMLTPDELDDALPDMHRFIEETEGNFMAACTNDMFASYRDNMLANGVSIAADAVLLRNQILMHRDIEPNWGGEVIRVIMRFLERFLRLSLTPFGYQNVVTEATDGDECGETNPVDSLLLLNPAPESIINTHLMSSHETDAFAMGFGAQTTYILRSEDVIPAFLSTSYLMAFTTDLFLNLQTLGKK